MENQIAFLNHPGYLRVTCKGEFPAETYREFLTAIRYEAHKSGHSRILIDAFALSAPATDMEKFWVGAAIAEIFGAQFRIAVLFKPELINRFTESSAVNRGARMVVMGEEEPALQWLMG